MLSPSHKSSNKVISNRIADWSTSDFNNFQQVSCKLAMAMAMAGWEEATIIVPVRWEQLMGLLGL
jgi:hypothetical protein